MGKEWRGEIIADKMPTLSFGHEKEKERRRDIERSTFRQRERQTFIIRIYNLFTQDVYIIYLLDMFR